MFKYLLFIASVCLFSVGGCKSSSLLRNKNASYTESAELNFNAGLEELKKGEHEKAISYFLFVKNKYPFTKFAALSDLKIAEARFDQEKWLDAASAYQVFIVLHPQNEEVEHAYFRMGLSYFNALPKEFFLFPKTVTKDQTTTQKALDAFEQFLVAYPTSAQKAETDAKIAILKSYLAKHELYVASYYERRGRYQQAFKRLEVLLTLYPNAPETCEGLIKAGDIALKKLKNTELAQQQYHEVIALKQCSEKQRNEAKKNIGILED